MNAGQTRWCTLAVVALTVAGSLMLAACRHTSDETQVREAIASGVHAAEQGAATGVRAPLTDDFDGNGGALDRHALVNIVRLVSLRGDHIGATLGPISIERRGERLVATFTLSLRSGGRLLPARMGLYRVESAWRKDDGEWRCYSATWKQVL